MQRDWIGITFKNCLILQYYNFPIHGDSPVLRVCQQHVTIIQKNVCCFIKRVLIKISESKVFCSMFIQRLQTSCFSAKHIYPFGWKMIILMFASLSKNIIREKPLSWVLFSMFSNTNWVHIIEIFHFASTIVAKRTEKKLFDWFRQKKVKNSTMHPGKLILLRYQSYIH